MNTPPAKDATELQVRRIWKKVNKKGMRGDSLLLLYKSTKRISIFKTWLIDKEEANHGKDEGS